MRDNAVTDRHGGDRFGATASATGPRVAARLTEARDAALMAGVIQGCPDAMSVLYRRRHRAVAALAVRVLGEGLQGEDVAQDVFARLWTRPDRFDLSRGSLAGYLMTMTHGRAVDVLRSEVARRRRDSRDNLGVAGADRAAAEAYVGVDRRRDADKVRAALAELPAGERQAITLALFGGHNHRQVAELLAVPEGTVRSRIRTGLRRLGVALPAFATASVA